MNLSHLFDGCHREREGFTFQGRRGWFLTFPNGSSFVMWDDTKEAA